MEITDLIREIKKYNKKANFKLLREAYEFAKKSHEGQKRLTGEDFIQHPLETAMILAKLKLDEISLIAALLHDVVEDTSVKLEEIKERFGKEVNDLVNGLTKITQLKMEKLSDKHAETIRKMLIASTHDLRVIVIKLADKLHNMRTIESLEPEKKKTIAREVMDVYAPLAYRLGLANIKWELEDLAFRVLEPEIYKRFKEKVARKRIQREKDVEKLVNLLKKELIKHNLKAEISGRPKHFYSIYKKMKKKNIGFDGIYDLLGLRVITETKKECYEILGIVHNLWKPLYKHFIDYIAVPKPNMYQSLHTVVIGSRKQPVEVQIRTKKMEEVAEEGIAAHWRYKDIVGDEKFDKRLSWLRQILDLEKDKAKDFLEKLKIDLFGDNIFCFTPKGDIIELPKDSTPVDFAYAVHSDIGNKCSGARVNGTFVSLRYKLNTGDVVEILTSKQHSPSRDWLSFVRTSKSIDKIKQALRESKNVPGGRGFFKKIEEENIGESILLFDNMGKVGFNFARCCNPLPGDNIIGFVGRGERVIVHKKECNNLGKVKRKKIKVNWADNFNGFLKLKISALDRVGLFADILNTIASTETNVKLANAKTIGNDRAECDLVIKFTNLKHLRNIIDRVYRIADIEKIRIE